MTNNFVFIGDSLTFGYGVHKEDCWVTKLNNLSNFNIINKGINGDTTTSMLDRFYDDVILNNPKSIFFMGGTNDLLSGRSVDSIISNIEEIIIDSKRINANLYIGIPPYIKKEMASKLFMPSSYYSYSSNSLPILREKLITLCNLNSIPYLDFYNLTLNNLDKDIYTDGIHLNFLGNTLMFEEAMKVLRI